jgi:hypothetical protein
MNGAQNGKALLVRGTGMKESAKSSESDMARRRIESESERKPHLKHPQSP